MISLIKLSISIEVFGSKPELGSSQNKYLGLFTIALAIATLFCIPPEISEGNFLCLHIQFKPFTIARLANLGMKFHGVKYSSLDNELKEISLTRVQQMVIYLYARNYSYTEVATWITRFGQKISPTAVNKQLAKLKTIFNVPDNEGLKDMSLKLGYDIAVPAEFLPTGCHDITEDVFDLWVC